MAFDSPARRTPKTLTMYKKVQSGSASSSGRGRGRGIRRKLHISENVEISEVEITVQRKLESDMADEVGKRRKASVEAWVEESVVTSDVDECNLHDMAYSDHRFTWSRLVAAPRTQTARLDRSLCNSL
ncbi:OLC1v1008461C1 [Oldenlandia corymbosa var. corymbosa]|uniref:OLC1v1008461C1 n=1 Tax=Oldenlandia corymbosa var. corymbosa TaxID=529605 RepID=A0AAV1DQ04_OLDCO|nr:OLC1v1008461C1 [Oldenlandia corymbosa var. corymbosa]